jgi:hypothetical protein
VIEVNASALRVDTEALRGPSKAAAPAPPRLRADFRGSTVEVSLDTADVVRDVLGIIRHPCDRKIPAKSGRGDWIRTSDPLRPRQVRYQAALRPDRMIVEHFHVPLF